MVSFILTSHEEAWEIIKLTVFIHPGKPFFPLNIVFNVTKIVYKKSWSIYKTHFMCTFQ